MHEPDTCGKLTYPSDKYTAYNNGGIHILNQDCLRYIFQCLPIVDRIRIERVCKHWQISSKDSWQDFRRLGFDNSYWGFKKLYTLDKISNPILKKVFDRCGQYIVCINFYEYNSRLGPNVLSTVAKSCHNILYLYASELRVSSKCIRTLGKRCSNLISFYMGECTEDCDQELSLLFKNNKKLEEIGVYGNTKITGLCLNKLNKECIKTIIFRDCLSVCFDYFNVVKTFHNLEVLIINHFHYANNRTMKQITSCLKKLKHLTLSLCPFYNDSFHHIAKLNNLVSLDLSYTISVNDTVLKAIGTTCSQLRKLDISFCISVTNEGLSKIVSLPQLRSLIIEDLDKITDAVFKNMPNLIEMDCSFCSNIRNPGLVALIESSDNIEHLYLNYCMNISNELLEAAIKATQKRNNNIILKLYLCNTNVKVGKASGRSPFLQVVPLIVADYVK